MSQATSPGSTVGRPRGEYELCHGEHSASCQTKFSCPKSIFGKTSCSLLERKCRLAIKERNRKKNIFRRNRTEESFENYKRAKGRAQWVVKNAKKECWQSFCSGLNRNTDLGTLWRTIKSMNGTTLNSQIPPIASESGIPLDNLGKAETLADTFALASSNANLSPNIAQIKNSFTLTPEIFQHDLYDSPLSDPISITEIHEALRKCGNSSTGPDGIHYDMLRKLPYSSLEGVLSLLDQSWLSGLPSSWKKATVIPILKKGKPSSAPSSYRHISLTSTLCKLLERVVAGRLGWFLESRNLLNSSQAGFRKGRGCADQIVRLVQDVAASSTQKKMTLGVFLDLEKAFDMVWREGIVNQLFQMGVKGRMLDWIHDFLQDRTIQVKVGTAFSRPHHFWKRHTSRQRFESTSLPYHDERDGKTNKGSPAVDVCRRHRPLDHRFQTG